MNGTFWRYSPGTRSWHVLVCLVLAGLLLAGCTSGEPDPVASAPMTQTTVEESVPAISEATPPTARSEVPEATSAPAPLPRLSDYILVDIEGPVTDRDATDVVLRMQTGAEIDRFRFPGAVGIHAQAGGRRSLIRTTSNQWGVLDGAQAALSLVSFPGTPPATAPVMDGNIAYWTDGTTPWMLRLDGGIPVDLEVAVGGAVAVTAISPNGNYVALRGNTSRLLDTLSRETTQIEQGDFLAFSDTNLFQVVTRPDGIVLTRSNLDASGTEDLAVLPQGGQLVPLPDGRVVVLSGLVQIVGVDGAVSTVGSIPTVQGMPVLTPDGATLITATAEGIARIDLTAGPTPPAATADPAAEASDLPPDLPTPAIPTDPATTGYSLVVPSVLGTVWAAPDPNTPDSDSPPAAPVLVLYPDGPRPLPDTGAPSRILSLDGDGSRGALRTEDGQVVIAGLDDAVQPVTADTPLITVELHPDGNLIAAYSLQGASSRVLVGDPAGVLSEILTGRSPTWLSTDATQG